jgi:hypothetical protein
MKGALLSRALLTLFFAAYSFYASAQLTSYTFKNSVLESGTALQTGAVYKFPSVKFGVDARITIMGSTGNITLTAIDENWTGFNDAFQPFIHVGTNANGYIEFKVEFYIAGTAVKMIQPLVPVSCIDVDGLDYFDGELYEKDQVQFLPGYYDFSMTGGNLTVNSINNWVVIKNTSAESYDGIDTTAKDVMATVVNSNTSGFLIRIGATNSSPTKSEVRYRSVYFKPFNYGHPVPLALKTIMNLSGSKKQNGVELKIQLASDHSFNKMEIERSANSTSFSVIGEMPVVAGSGAANPLCYLDALAGMNINYYRVRLINTETGKTEISNTIMIKAGSGDKTAEIMTSFLQPGNPVLGIRGQSEGEATVRLLDMSGNEIVKTRIRMNAGINSVNLPSFTSAKGYLLAVLETNGQLISRKLFIQ